MASSVVGMDQYTIIACSPAIEFIFENYTSKPVVRQCDVIAIAVALPIAAGIEGMVYTAVGAAHPYFIAMYVHCGEIIVMWLQETPVVAAIGSF